MSGCASSPPSTGSARGSRSARSRYAAASEAGSTASAGGGALADGGCSPVRWRGAVELRREASLATARRPWLGRLSALRAGPGCGRPRAHRLCPTRGPGARSRGSGPTPWASPCADDGLLGMFCLAGGAQPGPRGTRDRCLSGGLLAGPRPSARWPTCRSRSAIWPARERCTGRLGLQRRSTHRHRSAGGLPALAGSSGALGLCAGPLSIRWGSQTGDSRPTASPASSRGSSLAHQIAQLERARAQSGCSGARGWCGPGGSGGGAHPGSGAARGCGPEPDLGHGQQLQDREHVRGRARGWRPWRAGGSWDRRRIRV